MNIRSSAVAAYENLGTGAGERDGCGAVAVYSDIAGEYDCVRSRVGLQDLTYYGKIAVSGDGAMDLVNHFVMTDLARLPINQLQTSFLLDDSGRPVCELYIANLGDSYLLLSEGAPPSSVAALLSKAAGDFPGAVVMDRSDATGLIGIDGPYAWELLKTFLGLGVIGTRYLEVVPDQVIGGVEVTLARAGKTGEYGYLLLCAAESAVTLWTALKTAGERFGLLPIGYRVADLCKMENRVISQHHEGGAVGNVLELNTRVMLAREKDSHIGQEALQQILTEGVSRRLVGVTMPETVAAEDDGIKPGIGLSFGDHPVGSLVNAGYSFALKRWIGLALLDEPYACVGVTYGAQTQKGIVPASTVSAPFLFNKSLRIRPQEDSYFA